jgi:hypothetical protein
VQSLNDWLLEMAILIPTEAGAIAQGSSHRGELETLKQLKASLPDDYTVFHSVHWSRSNSRSTRFGEIDFVVLNRSGDTLIIEQKNGALTESSHGLVKQYRDRQKHVGDQVRRSLENVREKLTGCLPNGERPKLDYLILCPDHRLRSVNGAGLERNRIVDATQKKQLGERIKRILGPGDAGNKHRLNATRAFFRNTFEVVPDIHSHAKAQDRQYQRLSGSLIDFISELEMEPLRLRIKGTAGCGKSLVAAHFYDSALGSGKRPLLVCFNRPLKERFAALLHDTGKIATFHGLCDEFLQSQGRKPDFERADKNPDFWRVLAESVIEMEIPEDWKFDRLIVDEGQDFEADWLEILRLFGKPNHDLIWLEDPDQNLYGKAPIQLEASATFNARQNYRTPKSIAEFMRQTLPFRFDCTNPLPGLGVGVSTYDNPDTQPSVVARIVEKLLKDGFDYEDIVLLTCKGQANSVFSSKDKVGDLAVRRFTGSYNQFGNQVLTEGKLHFESVYRFKGQQAPAVILVDVDPDEARSDLSQKVLYCGMSRATLRLELVVNSQNQLNAPFIAASPPRKS